jgi:hypothetical protein
MADNDHASQQVLDPVLCAALDSLLDEIRKVPVPDRLRELSNRLQSALDEVKARKMAD